MGVHRGRLGYEATWEQHISAQSDQMKVQSETVKAELSDCKAAMG